MSIANISSKQDHPLRKQGFTLVEMLIVLTIIGVLVGILLPVLASARERSRRALCASNLRQISVAIEMYVNDNTGFYPGSAVFPPWCSCLDRIWPYIKSQTVFECPSLSEGQYNPTCTSSPGAPIPMPSAGYNLTYFGTGLTGAHRVRFRHPSRTIIALDGYGRDSGPGLSPLNGVQDLLTCGVKPRHHNGDNVLFADGHVKWMSMEAMVKRSLWVLND